MSTVDFSRYVLDRFAAAGARTIPTSRLFDNSPSNADVARALKQLEDQGLLVRFTYGGVDWVTLTSQAAVERAAAAERRDDGRTDAAPEIVYEHPHPIRSGDLAHRAYILGAARNDGTWSGWIEFVPVGGGKRVRTSQETSQPNREALAYWASGLEDVYYDGALARAAE